MPSTTVAGIIRGKGALYLQIEFCKSDMWMARQCRRYCEFRLQWHLDDVDVNLRNRVQPPPAMGPDDCIEIACLQTRSGLHQKSARYIPKRAYRPLLSLLRMRC